MRSFQKSLFVRCIEKPLRWNHCQWFSPTSLKIQLHSARLPGNGLFTASATTQPRLARRKTKDGGYLASDDAADLCVSGSGDWPPIGKPATAAPFSSNVVRRPPSRKSRVG